MIGAKFLIHYNITSGVGDDRCQGPLASTAKKLALLVAYTSFRDLILVHTISLLSYPKVKLTCARTALESSGDLLYCYNRGKKIFQGLKHLIFSGTIKCCFENHSCVKNWTIMQTRVYKRAKWVHISYFIYRIIYKQLR